MPRVHNFNPGPAALPMPVLEKIKNEMLDFRGSGMSILEISHRSKEFEAVLGDAQERFARLLGLPAEFKVLFIQGGASTQFAMAAMNLCAGRRPAYALTGTWAVKAFKEAVLLGCDPTTAASSEDRNFCYIPKTIDVPAGAAYLHLTSNNTIKGTQWREFPRVDAPLVADMSSDILSRPFDPSPFGMFYAGAQKNLGPAGVTLVAITQEMLARVPKNLPNMMRYTTYSESNSLYNTPPCFAIYVVDLVLEWLEETVGGLARMAAINREKAALVYGAIDGSGGFYRGTADLDSRSLMNVTFRLANESLEPVFLAEALKAGLAGLKGHRSVGGCRASIYNCVAPESTRALADFMADFARRNG